MAHQKKLTEFRAKVFLAFIGAYLVSWSIILAAIYLSFDKQQTVRHTEIRSEFTRQFDQLILSRSKTFAALLGVMAARPELEDHLTQNDNNYLYRLFERNFKRLSSVAKISRFNISDVEQRNIVRFQSPNRYGDHTARYLGLTMNENRAEKSGIYMEPNGAVVHRVMKPLFHNDQHTGYMEIGSEIYIILDFIAEQFNASVYIMIEKNQLKQEDWEKGKAKFDWPGEWNNIEDFVIAGGSNYRDMLDGQLKEHFMHGSVGGLGEIEFNGEIFIHDIIPLQVSDLGRVGTIFIAYPQRVAVGVFMEYMKKASLASAIAFSIGLLICYLLFRPIAASIEARQADLENQITDQTTDLVAAKERAVIERNRAVLANKTKSDFLSNMSHELRTPLNSIIGFSSIIKNDEFGDGVSERYASYVDDIHRSGSHLLSIINDILDVSRIEAGELDLKIQRVNVNTLLAECQRMINVRATVRQVAILHDQYDESLVMDADPTRLKQIILNLLANAVKFTSAPGIVRFSAKRIGVSKIKFEVSDEGIGIAKDDIPNILRRFGQAAGNILKKPQEEGTGLGLTLVQDLVKMHGGKVDFKSKLGEGTRVSFILPVAHEPPEDTHMI